jgi:beta-glucanase (GH16 family)
MANLNLTGYKLTFADEFNNRSISYDGSGATWADSRVEWRMADGKSDIGFGMSSFVDAQSGYDPFSVAGGALTITAVPDRTAFGYPGAWESGLITTQSNFSQKYGYFEMRADLSNSAGAWDAFWLLPNQQKLNPSSTSGWQELDVVEHYGVSAPSTFRWIHTTEDHPDANASLQVYSANPEQAAGYHTYGMDWQADKISFYFDDKFMGSQNTPSDMHDPMYLLANLAVTANDLPSSTTVLDSMKIDYVRAFSADPNATAISHQSVSAPDGHDPGLYGATTAGQATNPAAPMASLPAVALAVSPTLAPAVASIPPVDTQALATNSVQHEEASIQVPAAVADAVQTSPETAANQSNSASESAGQGPLQTSAGEVTAHAEVQVTETGDAPPISPLHEAESSVAKGADFAQSPATSTPSSSAQVALEHNLNLVLSGDQYDGAPIARVSVDGHVVGEYAVAASHKMGEWQTISIAGDQWLDSGEHSLNVMFINDKWDGTPDTDRNLWFRSAQFDADQSTGDDLWLNGHGHFTTFAFKGDLPPGDKGANAIEPALIIEPLQDQAADQYTGAHHWTV